MFHPPNDPRQGSARVKGPSNVRWKKTLLVPLSCIIIKALP